MSVFSWGCSFQSGGVSRSWCTHTSLCVPEIATRPMHQFTEGEIALMRQMKGLNGSFFLYARVEMRLYSAFTARNTQYFCAYAQVEVQITLHTPPSFTGYFPARCRPSQPCCVQNRGFLPSGHPTTPPFSHTNASFSLNYYHLCLMQPG